MLHMETPDDPSSSHPIKNYLDEHIDPSIAQYLLSYHQARYLRYLAATETMATMAGQIRYYEPIPHGIFPDD